MREPKEFWAYPARCPKCGARVSRIGGLRKGKPRSPDYYIEACDVHGQFAFIPDRKGNEHGV